MIHSCPKHYTYGQDKCGKGVSIEQAKASALMEAVERYSCELFIKERKPFIVSSYDNLKENALSPLDLLLPLSALVLSYLWYYRIC